LPPSRLSPPVRATFHPSHGGHSCDSRFSRLRKPRTATNLYRRSGAVACARRPASSEPIAGARPRADAAAGRLAVRAVVGPPRRRRMPPQPRCGIQLALHGEAGYAANDGSKWPDGAAGRQGSHNVVSKMAARRD
jgi:hypothetical protein